MPRNTKSQYRRSAYNDLYAVAEYLIALNKPLPADLMDEMAEAGIDVEAYIAAEEGKRDTSINIGFELV